MIRELTYTLTKEDEELYEKEYIQALKEERKNAKFSLSIKKGHTLIFVIFLLYFFSKIFVAFGITGIIIGVPISILFYFFITYCRYFFYKNVIDIKFLFKGQKDYTLSINSKNGTVDGKLFKNNRWYNFNYSCVYNFYVTEHFVSLIIVREHGAIIIPRRVFKNDTELQSFCDLLVECSDNSSLQSV